MRPNQSPNSTPQISLALVSAMTFPFGMAVPSDGLLGLPGQTDA